jgi:hypothetical protein
VHLVAAVGGVIHANRPQPAFLFDDENEGIVEHLGAAPVKLDEQVNAASSVKDAIVCGAGHACTERDGTPHSPPPDVRGVRFRA